MTTADVVQPAQRKRKRRTHKRRPELVRYKVAVSAASIRISRMGPGLIRYLPDGECRSVINIEGALKKPVGRDVRTAGIYVFEGDGDGGDPGSAIGFSKLRQVVLYLPRPQFDDLRAMVLADKLATVDLLTDGLSRGKGTIRSVAFETVPVPSEQDEDEADEDASAPPDSE